MKNKGQYYYAINATNEILNSLLPNCFNNLDDVLILTPNLLKIILTDPYLNKMFINQPLHIFSLRNNETPIINVSGFDASTWKDINQVTPNKDLNKFLFNDYNKYQHIFIRFKQLAIKKYMCYTGLNDDLLKALNIKPTKVKNIDLNKHYRDSLN